MEKYDEHGSFADPVVRCDKCQKIIKTVSLIRFGKCKHCSGRKVSSIGIMNEEEYKQLQDWGIDKDFLKRFEGVEDDD